MMVMVPALLGLKGNLEMTLASRLSTVSWEIKKKLFEHDNLKIFTITSQELFLAKMTILHAGIEHGKAGLPERCHVHDPG